jgi:hypothetical protein
MSHVRSPLGVSLRVAACTTPSEICPFPTAACPDAGRQRPSSPTNLAVLFDRRPACACGMPRSGCPAWLVRMDGAVRVDQHGAEVRLGGDAAMWHTAWPRFPSALGSARQSSADRTCGFLRPFLGSASRPDAPSGGWRHRRTTDGNKAKPPKSRHASGASDGRIPLAGPRVAPRRQGHNSLVRCRT